MASTARNKLVNTEVDCLERIDKGLDNLAMIRKLTGFDPENKRILEVGTGRHGIDCLIFYVLGAEAISTFDHVLHLEKDIMASAIEPLLGRLDDISAKFEVDKGEMVKRIEEIVTYFFEDIRYKITGLIVPSMSLVGAYARQVMRSIPIVRNCHFHRFVTLYRYPGSAELIV